MYFKFEILNYFMQNTVLGTTANEQTISNLNQKHGVPISIVRI